MKTKSMKNIKKINLSRERIIYYQDLYRRYQINSDFLNEIQACHFEDLFYDIWLKGILNNLAQSDLIIFHYESTNWHVKYNSFELFIKNKYKINSDIIGVSFCSRKNIKKVIDMIMKSNKYQRVFLITLDSEKISASIRTFVSMTDNKSIKL